VSVTPVITLVNLTPHAVIVLDENGEVIVCIQASGTIARLVETVAEAPEVLGVPGVTVALGPIDGLPDQVDGTTYVVSMPLLMGMRAAGIDRPDCVYPFGQVRDDQGRIIGCRSFARIT